MRTLVVAAAAVVAFVVNPLYACDRLVGMELFGHNVEAERLQRVSR